MRVMPRFVSRLPGTVVQTLGVRPGEKVIAWGSGPGAESDQPAFTAATYQALYSQALGRRIPWDRISKATWEDPILEVVVLDGTDRPSSPVRVRLDDARDLPAAVHDRVTGSVVVSERADLGNEQWVQMIARRGSDDDAIRWSLVFDAGLDPDDPLLRAAADAALVRYRDALGI